MPLKKIADSALFHHFMIGFIAFAAVLVGVETYPSMVARYGSVLHVLDQLVLALFTVEIVIKMGALGRNALHYFKDPWNVFDFLIVAVCFVPMDAQFVAVLRLVRILRVLKLITALPRLQMIVGALLKSIPSIGYVGLLLVLHFYIFAVIATSFFGGNDPFRFGTLQTSMLTLFQVVTMEGWADIMQTQMLGCDRYGYDDTIKHLCTQPSTSPVFAPLYFVGFIIIGTMIILNLFIGVIMKGMEEMQDELLKRDEAQAKAEGRALSIEDRLAAAMADLDRARESLRTLLAADILSQDSDGSSKAAAGRSRA
jgi:voltage-gated sodium channel